MTGDKLLPTLMFTALFLGFFSLLMLMMPQQIAEGIEGREQNYPDYLDSKDLIMYAEWYNNTIDSSFWTDSYELGNRPFFMEAYYGQNAIRHYHYHYFLWFKVNGHSQKWYDVTGKLVSTLNGHNEISKETLDNAYDNETGRCEFSLRCDHTALTIWFSFNDTTFSTPSEAWAGNELSWTTAVEFDKVGTSWNAWTLISSFLFFQAPNVHPLLNVFIALPFWICFAYLVYRLILLALPFVG